MSIVVSSRTEFTRRTEKRLGKLPGRCDLTWWVLKAENDVIDIQKKKRKVLQMVRRVRSKASEMSCGRIQTSQDPSNYSQGKCFVGILTVPVLVSVKAKRSPRPPLLSSTFCFGTRFRFGAFFSL